MTEVHSSPEYRAQVIAKADYAKMREIARAVYEKPSLLSDFERDPAAAARAINGFEVPAGFHIHIADADNKFYPAEEHGRFGAEGEDKWDRVEMRAGYKTFSLVGCA